MDEQNFAISYVMLERPMLYTKATCTAYATYSGFLRQIGHYREIKMIDLIVCKKKRDRY